MKTYYQYSLILLLWALVTEVGLAQTCLYAEFTFDIDTDGCTVDFSGVPRSGIIDLWEWDFGDGATAQGRFVSHSFTENNCFPVRLTVYSGSDSRSYTQQVCLSSCSTNPGYNPSPDCHISGTGQAGAGHTIILAAEGVGVGPFHYQWSTPSDVTPFNPSGASHEFTISDSRTNGEQLNFTLTVTDALGYTSICSHQITVSGNVPTVKLGVFGSMQSNTYLAFAAYVDRFNLTGPEKYLFKVRTDAGLEVASSSWQDGDWDWEIIDGLPNGAYTACVDVRDDLATYSDCQNFQIGTPPPPSPAMELVILDLPQDDPTPNILEPGDCAKIGVIGNHPGIPYINCGNKYFIEWTVEKLATGEIVTSPTTATDCQDFWACYNAFKCYQGTVAITAKVSVAADPGGSGCCFAEGTDPQPYFITEPVFLEVIYEPVQIDEVELVTTTCEPYLKILASSGCQATPPVPIPSGAPCTGTQPYSSYTWRTYHVDNPDTELQNFLLGPANSSCLTVNRNHPIFKEADPRRPVDIVVEVEVTDELDFTQESRHLIRFGPQPLDINLPAKMQRCPGSQTILFDGYTAAGGTAPITYDWSNSPNLSNLDLSDPMHPTLNIPPRLHRLPPL